MVAFADLFSLQTRTAIKARLLAIATDAGLPITSWIPGDPSERWTEIIPRAIDEFLSNYTTQAVRAFFFDLNTDPGDAGDLSADQTPRPGFLSAFGAGWWGTERGGATYATTSITLTNTGSAPATFAPYNLTFQRSTANADGGYPTYRNSEDPAIYTGLGGTLTLAPSASATIPVVCEQVGSQGTAAPGEISVVVNGSYGTFTATNPTAAIGEDREDRATYIARCRQQSGAASPNGAQDAYRYAATTGADGKPLQLWDGSGATTVNRVYVSGDSSTNQVLIYMANESGPATTVEVSSANANINGITIGDANGVVHNLHPIGVVPDCIVLGPTISDGKTGAPGPAKATATNIGPLCGTTRIKGRPGVESVTLISDIHDAFEAALLSYFKTVPIGGLDQVAGVGTIYMRDLENVIRDSYPGLYATYVTKPASAGVTLSLGHVAVYVGSPAVTGAANNGSGAVRLEVASSTIPADGDAIQIYKAETGGGLSLLGVWYVDRIDATHIDLYSDSMLTVPSVWTGTFTSATFSCVVVTVA